MAEQTKNTKVIGTQKKWIKQKIPNKYDFKGKIIEFSPKDHKSNNLFCRCNGGFGSFYKCSGTMILGRFYPTLQEAIEDKGDEDKVGGNTRAFPITQYVEEVEK